MAKKFYTTFGLLCVLRFAAMGTAAGDVTTTAVVLHQGGHEANPLMTRGTVITATAVDTGMLAGIYTLEAKHPRIAKVLYVAVIASRGLATVHNGRQIR